MLSLVRRRASAALMATFVVFPAFAALAADVDCAAPALSPAPASGQADCKGAKQQQGE